MTVSRLRPYATTVFAEMSALAARVGAVNLGQGFPDEDGPPAMLKAAQDAIAEGVNQYPPGIGIPALREAAGLIARCRPALYLENDREDGLGELIALVQGFGYRLWWHIVPLFDPGNHAGQGRNGFPGVVALNLLALPAGRPCPWPGLLEVSGPAQSWREAAWNA